MPLGISDRNSLHIDSLITLQNFGSTFGLGVNCPHCSSVATRLAAPGMLLRGNYVLTFLL